MKDAGQVIRQYLTIAKRQWWVLAQAMVIVGAVAAFMATRVTEKPYHATTTLIVDQSATTTVDQQQSSLRLAQLSQQVLASDVLQAAAAGVPGETPASIAAATRSVADPRNGTISITATAPSPDRPTAIAAGVAQAFVDAQRAAKTANLRQSQADTEAQAKDLAARLAQIDSQSAARALAGLPVDPSAKAERDALSAHLNQVYTSLESLRLQISAAAAGVDVLFPATAAVRDPKPSPVTRGAQGVAAGLVIGIALAALREVLDTRLRDRAAIEAELPWPTLGTVVGASGVGRSLATLDQPAGPIAEAMRQLRTNLRFVEAGEPIRSLVVTSAEPGDGKTFVAANLAASYALLGVRTVIVSGDLRRPTIDAFFMPRAGRGLGDVLTEAIARANGELTHTAADWAPPAPVETLLRWTGVPNLWLLPAGDVQHNPAELLATEHATKLLDQLAQVAEMVVIDAPPLLVVDPVLLGGMADGLVVVASIGTSQRDAVRHAREVLESSRERVLGIVLNRATAKRGTYGYYGYAYEKAPARPATDRPEQKSSRRALRRARKAGAAEAQRAAYLGTAPTKQRRRKR